jgi:hypothetical protein
VFENKGLLDIIGEWLDGIQTILFAKLIFLLKSDQFVNDDSYKLFCELP